MYCKNCGQQIPDDAQFCSSCGYSTGSRPNNNEQNTQPQQTTNTNTQNKEHNEPKTALGVIFSLFLGLIGLLIGILLYPEGTVARNTFIKAWLITYIVTMAITLVGSFLVYIVIMTALPY